jgi:hypothetical protein
MHPTADTDIVMIRERLGAAGDAGRWAAPRPGTMNKDTPPSVRASSEMLVQAFFDVAAAQFRTALQERLTRWDADFVMGTEHASAKALPERIHSFFLASCRFVTREISGEVTFGDREFFINMVLGPSASTRRYGLWEWADAFDRPALVPRETDWVFQLDRLQDILRQMAIAAKTLAPLIATASPDVFQRLEDAREKVRAQWEAEMQESEHRATVLRANEAFRLHQWNRVVELLESVRFMLTPAEKLKLKYARRRAHAERD